jgi:hypothetical protein
VADVQNGLIIIHPPPPPKKILVHCENRLIMEYMLEKYCEMFVNHGTSKSQAITVAWE